MTTSENSKEFDFAIVIPVGAGHRPWLESSVKSIACQKAKVGIALCAVEDSSQLRDIIGRYKDLIAYLRIGPDTGQSAAINEGWGQVSAQIYGWLNDDDMLHPNALDTVWRRFKTTDADVVHGKSTIWKDGIITSGYGNRPVTEAILRDNMIAQPSTFVRCEALSKITLIRGPLDEERHFTMDWDLWQRLYKSGACFSLIQTPLSLTRWYKGTKTESASFRKYQEYLDLLSQNTSYFRALWSLTNIFLHNQATYGRYAPLFWPITMALSARTNSQDTNPSPPLELFHFEEAPLTPVINFNDKETPLEPLLSGDVLTVTADSAKLLSPDKNP